MLRKKIYLSFLVSLLLLVGLNFSTYDNLVYGKDDGKSGDKEKANEDDGKSGDKEKAKEDDGDDNDLESISLEELFNDEKEDDEKEDDEKEDDEKEDDENDIPFILPFNAVPFP